MAGEPHASKAEHDDKRLGVEEAMVKGESVQSQEVKKVKTCILILGTEGSGTSVLAGVLNKLGCALPSYPIESRGEDADASCGSAKVRDLNDELLLSAGSSREDFTPFPSDWLQSPNARDFLKRASSVLAAEFGDAPFFALEDPAICRLAPFWIEALERFGCRVRPILIIRSPLDIGNTQDKNSGEPLKQMIWLRNVLDSENATRGKPRLHTSFEELTQGWETVAEKAQDELSLVWPKPAANAEFDVARYLSGYLDAERKSQARALTSTLLPDWIRVAYQILNGWVLGEEMVAHQSKLDRIKAEFDVASLAFARLIRFERNEILEQRLKATGNVEREALETEMALLLAKIAVADQEINLLKNDLQEHRAKIAVADQETNLLKNDLQEQRRSATLMRAELHELKEDREDLESHMRDVRSELAASRARRKEMARVIARRDAEIQVRYQELATLERRVLRFSPSWWFSVSVRRIKRLIRGESGKSRPSQTEPA